MKRGTIIILVILSLVLIGLAYYFLIYKKSKALKEGTNGTNSGSGSGSGSGTGSTGCIPYTQQQQTDDVTKCMSNCDQYSGFKKLGCINDCQKNKKPVKTC